MTALVAIAVTIPLAAGTFNLAVGTEVGLAAILSAWLLETAHARRRRNRRAHDRRRLRDRVDLAAR